MLRRYERTPLLLFLSVVIAGAAVLSTGCARQSEDDALTTLDSSLAMDSSLAGTDVPDPGPTPSEQFEEPAPPPATPAPKPKPSPKPTPAPKPSPQPVVPQTITVPRGTDMAMTLDQTLTTKTAQAGQSFSARVADDVVVDGMVAIPAGSVVNGHLVLAQRSGKASGKAYMQLAYDQVVIDGETYNIESVSDTVYGKGGGSKDAKLIGGSAVAGAVLGGLLGGGASDAAKGAVIGGAAGTGASLLTRGPDLEMKAGQTLTVSLDRSVAVARPKAGA
jgi:hypothetical protein